MATTKLHTDESVDRVGVTIRKGRKLTVNPKPKSAKSIAFDFFYANAGSSHNPLTETPEQGRARGARQLAQAEARASALGYEFNWVSDVEGCSGCDCGNEECDCFSGNLHEVLGCIAVDADGEEKASLWGICGATREYRRVVEAELALEALASA